MQIFLFLLMFLLLLSSAQSVHAQSALSLGILPPVIEITADPPAEVEAEITIQNMNQNSQELSIELRPFKLSSQRDGQVEFLKREEIAGNPVSTVLEKVKIFDGEDEVKTVRLGPLESKDLMLVIALDENTSLGDYYFSIVFMTTAGIQPEASASVTAGGIATNVILSLGEKGDTRGQIIDFSAPFLNFSGPIPITLLLRNDSRHYINPTGTVTIKNMFGKEIERLTILPQYILAESERYMRDTNQASPSAEIEGIIQELNSPHPNLIWSDKFLFGLYTANVNVKLSENGPLFATEARFIALPLYLIFAISFLTFILIGIYLRVKRKV